MAARVTRFDAAPRYEPPLHNGVAGRRLQGLEAGPTDAFWVGHSHYPPGADSELAPTAAETVYVVLGGELTLHVEGEQPVVLRRLDSVHLPQGTVRRVVNDTGDDVEVLVAIASAGGPDAAHRPSGDGR
ncbi:cupin domain-containing protein [Jatrophihabitans fulvus]